MINIRKSLDDCALKIISEGLNEVPYVMEDGAEAGDVLFWSSEDARIESGNLSAAIHPYPGRSKVTIVAEAPVCKDVSGVKSTLDSTFNLPPKAVTLSAYTTDGVLSDCYSVGDTVIFKAIASNGGQQVDGIVYKWNHLPGWDNLSEDGAEAIVVVTASPTLVQQVSYFNPMSYCQDSRVASKQIAFYAAAPTITTPELCMDVNLVNNVTLSVEPQSGVSSYNWTYRTDDGEPAGVATTSGALNLTFNGVPGIYGYSVSPVSQISSSGCICGAVSSSASVSIPSVPSGVELATNTVNRGTKMVFKYYVDGVQQSPEAWLVFDDAGGYTVEFSKTLSVFICDYDDEKEEDIILKMDCSRYC